MRIAAVLRTVVVLLPLLLLMPLGRPHAEDVLFTFGDMLGLRELPLQSAKRALTNEELILYQNLEFYAYTAFEALQVANSAAELINKAPLFCAPESTFHFDQDGDIARLADYVTAQLFSADPGEPLNRYDDRPASQVLLLGLRAAFPCAPDDDANLAQR